MPDNVIGLPDEVGLGQPLTYGQERLWFLHRLMPDEHAYNVTIPLRLRGELDTAALHAATRRIIERHSVLRTSFPALDGRPAQRIATGTVAPTTLDRSGVPAADRDATAAALAADAARRPFDLAAGPLVRVDLIRFAPTDHVLIWTTHHIVFDGSSTAVLYRELTQLYHSFHNGQPDPLPPPATQYRDYAVWERGPVAADRMSTQLPWWLAHLAGSPYLLDLPTDRPRPEVARFAGANVTLPLPAQLWHRLLRLSRVNGMTPASTLYTLCATLLATYAGQPDLIVGLPMTRPRRPETTPLIGMFADLLAIRVRVDPTVRLSELLAQVRSSVIGALNHNDVPFEHLVDRLRAPRTLAYNPLVQAVFAPDLDDPALPQLDGLLVEPIVVPASTVKFDLVFSVAPVLASADREVTVAYRVDLFDAATAEGLAAAFRALIDAATADPDATVADVVAHVPRPQVTTRPVADAPRATVAEHVGRMDLQRRIAEIWAQVLELPDIDPQASFFDVGGNSLSLTRVHARLTEALHRPVPLLTLYQYPTVASLTAHLVRHTEPGPAAPAGADNGRERLDRRRRRSSAANGRTSVPVPAHPAVHQLFEWQARVRPDHRAVIDADRVFGYAELNSAANRLAHLLRRAGVSAESRVGILVERSAEFVIAVLAALKAGGSYVPLDPALPAPRLHEICRRARPSVVITRTGLADALPADGYPLLYVDDPAATHSPGTDLGLRTGQDAVACVMFTSGSTGEPKGVLVTHRGVVGLVRDADYVRLGPDDVIAQVASVSFDASTFEIWAALLNGGTLAVGPAAPLALADIGALIRTHGVTTALLTTGLFHLLMDERPADLAPLRQLLVGGDVLSTPHALRAVHTEPERVLRNAYGPTEATTLVTTQTVPADWPPDRGIPLGRPIRDAVVRILDAYHQLTPVGVPGQIHLGGAGLARGYLDDPAGTAQSFVPDPFGAQPGARLYATGDRGRYLPDGTIEFVGRVDQQVKIRGFRVEPGEVEATLRACPEVRDAVVTTRGDRAETRQLVTYLRLPSDADPERTVSAARGWLRTRLPAYLVPDVWIPVDSLPLTAQGKVDRDRLAAIDPAGSGEPGPTEAGTTEREVGAVWAEVLGVERVGRHDDFFDLGGYSILAMRVLMRLRHVLGVDLPLSAMFDHPTVAELTEFIVATEQAL